MRSRRMGALTATGAMLASFAIVGLTPSSAAAAECESGLRKWTAQENSAVRKLPKVNSTKVGLLLKGKKVRQCRTGPQSGDTYTACGLTMNLWVKVNWQGKLRYIAAGCLN